MDIMVKAIISKLYMYGCVTLYLSLSLYVCQDQLHLVRLVFPNGFCLLASFSTRPALPSSIKKRAPLLSSDEYLEIDLEYAKCLKIKEGELVSHFTFNIYILDPLLLFEICTCTCIHLIAKLHWSLYSVYFLCISLQVIVECIPDLPMCKRIEAIPRDEIDYEILVRKSREK